MIRSKGSCSISIDSSRDANHLKKIIKKSHKTSGKLWIGKDWRPEHLELIYKFYNDQIVDHYLNGDFLREEPNLHRQFK